LSSQFRPKQLKICLTLTYNKYYTAYSVSVRISYLLKPNLAHGPGDGDEVGYGKPDNDVKQLREILIVRFVIITIKKIKTDLISITDQHGNF